MAPYQALVHERRRVARDCFVTYAGSWYSAPAEYAGREVWVGQTKGGLLICDRDEVRTVHPLAEKPYKQQIIRAHFVAVAMRRDLRLSWRSRRRWLEPITKSCESNFALLAFGIRSLAPKRNAIPHRSPRSALG